MIIDEIQNIGDGAGLGREAGFRCTDMRLYFTGFWRRGIFRLGCHNRFLILKHCSPSTHCSDI